MGFNSGFKGLNQYTLVLTCMCLKRRLFRVTLQPKH